MRRFLISRTGVEEGGLWRDAGERTPRRFLGVAWVGREATTNGRPSVCLSLSKFCAYRDFHSVTGTVFRTSDYPIATGGSQDIHTGEWTGQGVRWLELLSLYVS